MSNSVRGCAGTLCRTVVSACATQCRIADGAVRRVAETCRKRDADGADRAKWQAMSARSGMLARMPLPTRPLRRTVAGAGAIGALLVAAAPAVAQSPVTQTYTSTTPTSFTVPANVTSITVQAIGGNGGNALGPGGAVVASGGQGRVVNATLPVTPGEVLWIVVGGNGANSSQAFGGGGGGGASDIRTCAPGASTCSTAGTSLQSRLIVAGGGGGGGGSAAGGDGGDSDDPGDDGVGIAGSGGNAGATNGGGQGGSGSANPGATGTLGAGGAGGQETLLGQTTPPAGGGAGGANGGANGGGTNGTFSGGGGGGGGWYGGGGGAGSSPGTSGGGGGGGGGASYATSGATNVSMSWSSAQPSITLTYTPATPPPAPPHPPILASVSPTSGSTLGGTVVTLTGSYFAQQRTIYFGGIAAPRFSILGFSTIQVVSPPYPTAGTVPVRVEGPFGVSATAPGAQFTYVAPTPTPSPTPTPTPTPAPPTPSTSSVCRVPNVLGETLSQARRALRSRHCALGAVSGAGRSTRTRRVVVHRQSIPPGTHLLPGDQVQLEMRAVPRRRR